MPSFAEDEIGDEGAPADAAPPDPQEIQFLREVERNLAAVVSRQRMSIRRCRWSCTICASGVGWRERRDHLQPVSDDGGMGAGGALRAFPDEPVALYAGGAASFVQRGDERRTAAREQIKRAIQDGDIRLVCATDAACEGLNLQRLGAQVNIDMPWNPSRLEQRKGRIQRIGQARDNVHVLNLRYAGTVEDEVYAALSQRFGDIFSVLGQLAGLLRGRVDRRRS